MIILYGMQVIVYQPLGPQAGEALHMGKLILGHAVLTSLQRSARRDPNSGKISNARKIRASCL